jgi:hypothetical protein
MGISAAPKRLFSEDIINSFMKSALWVLLAALLIANIYAPALYSYSAVKEETSKNDFFFGVTFGGNTTSQAKLLINKVKDYTNLFIISSWDVTANETLLTEICDYAVDAKMNVIVFFSFVFYNYTDQEGNDLISGPLEKREESLVFYNYTHQSGSVYNSSDWEALGIDPFHMSWLNKTRERWGDKFLGVYLYDEPGGKQIDTGFWDRMAFGRNDVWFAEGNITAFRNVTDYSEAANLFVRSLYRSGSMQHVINSSVPDSISSPLPVFTADYALYWFDYLAGYDVVFAELGWGHSETQHIALCRGASNVQNKKWGAIITWADDAPPYLADGEEMLQQMLTAYYAGVNYLTVFNYPIVNPYGSLTEEHFVAIERFWSQIHAFPRSMIVKMEDEVAFVLPKDYGWGMRSQEDNIWGFWLPDDASPMIWENMNKLIQKYGLKLDIIYDDPQFDYADKYSKIYFWNSTID